MVGVYTTDGTPTDAYNFYDNNNALDVTQAKKVGVGGALIGNVEFKGTYTGSVTIAGRDSKTYLVIVLKSSETSPSSTTSTTAAAS